MSKLIKFKEWLTIEETAKYLSNKWSEPVTEADVLKLGLDKHLKLSVNFVNSVPAKKGKIVSYLEAKRSHKVSLFSKKDVDDFFHSVSFEFDLEKETDGSIQLAVNAMSNYLVIPPDEILHGLEQGSIDGISIGNGLILELDSSIINIEGVCDLPMIGSELLDVSWRYHLDALGVETNGIKLDGTFVSDNDNIMYQIQDFFGDYHNYKAARDRQFNKLRKLQLSKSTNRRKAKLIELRQEKFKELDAQWNKWNRIDRYYPAGGLSDDSILVVRTSAIAEFLSTLDIETEPEQQNNIKPIIKPNNIDDTFKAIYHHIQKLEDEFKRTPEFTELFYILIHADLSYWGVNIEKSDKKRIQQRYNRYYPTASIADQQ